MADQVKIKTGVDSSGVKTGLAHIKNQFAGLKASIGGSLRGSFGLIAGAAAAGAGLRSIFGEADHLQDLNDKLGVSAEALQMLGNVAKKNGGSLDDVSDAMGKILVAQAKVRKGDEGMKQSLAALGIGQAEFVNLSPDQAFLRIADAVSKSNDDSIAYAATLDLMGRNAGNLFATLKMGGDEIKRVNDELGGIIDDATVQQIADVTEKLEGFFLRLKGLTADALGGAFKYFEFVGARAAELVGMLTGDQAMVLVARQAKQDAKFPKKKDKGEPKVPFDPEDLEKKDKDKAAKAPKAAQIIADALTRAGGGGIAYIAPEAQVQVNMAKDIAQMKESVLRQEKTAKNIEKKTGWQP